MNDLKKKALNKCMELLDEKINSLNGTLTELAEGAKNDSKSSAGDKHETARAMMQLEQEKISKQLAEAHKTRANLQIIDINLKNEKVIKGSLVETSQGILFLAVGLGKISINSQQIIVISPESPLGQKLMGLSKNDQIQINATKYQIFNVF